MSRRKIIIPYWSVDKDTVIDKKLIENRFNDFQVGELLINTNPENTSLSLLNENGDIEYFVSENKLQGELDVIREEIENTVGSEGPQGAKGETGEKGPKGEDGKSVAILGTL